MLQEGLGSTFPQHHQRKLQKSSTDVRQEHYCMNSNNIEIKFEAKNNQSVAYDGNNAIGRCKFARLKGQWVITLTDVEKEYGGQGIGKQLVLKVIDEA